ncbi:MAG: DUF1801 domain-containing protein [Tepidisphaera sp.]
MQSKVTTVAAYLAELPEDRKAAITTLVNLIRKNVDKDIDEGILYGMIGFSIPHRVYPAGYHCDPKLPLGYIALASQKNYMSLYINWVYYGAKEGGVPGPDGGDNEHVKWFNAAWAKTGKKLDMGKCCIRFKKIEDLPLDVIAEAIRRVPTRVAIQHYERIRDQTAKGKPASGDKAPAKAAAKKPVKKAAKTAAKKSPVKAGKKTAKKAAR